MNIKRETINRLRLEHDRRTEVSVRNLLDGNTEGAEEDLRWLNASSELLAHTDTWWARMKLPGIIALICILISAFLSFWPVSSTHIQFELETGNVRFTLDKKWAFDPRMKSDEIYIDNIREISSGDLDISGGADAGQEKSDMELRGRNIGTGKLILEKDTEVELGGHDDELKLFIKGQALESMLIVQSVYHLKAGKKTVEGPLYFEPGIIRFRAEGHRVNIRFVSRDNWQMGDMQVSDIRFSEESAPGSGEFESAIHSGRLKLSETESERELRKGDCLVLDGVKSRRLEMSKAENGVKIFFEGSVSKIHAGPKAFLKDLTPTCLEYFYHDSRAGFLWGAVFLLWSVLWGIWNTIFRM
ncbi:hypothetical protein QUF80_15800 [Desulfococcaceae bacterium HSG8]|nr:hypothetical protein [Desulfococcaceae bacterium HSG8]